MPFPFIAAATMLAPVVGGLIQSRHNKNLAKYQNAYNDPASQMARYRAAGLNPNLVYTQGNPGNMTAITPTDFQSAIGGIPQRYQQSKLTEEQIALTGAKTEESQMKREVMDAQKDLIKANPYLNETYINSFVKNMESVAKLKAQEATFMTSEQAPTGATTQGEAKMMLEVNRLAQQFELGVQDQEIKAKIIQSKEYENAVKKLMADWYKDGEMTWQHMYQGILMIIGKMMN